MMIEKQRELANAVLPKTERLYQKFEGVEEGRVLPSIRVSRELQQQNSESNRTAGGQRQFSLQPNMPVRDGEPIIEFDGDDDDNAVEDCCERLSAADTK